jgi:hypothetical protein
MTPGLRLWLTLRRAVLTVGVTLVAHYYGGWAGVFSSLVVVGYLEDVSENPGLWRKP